MKQSTPANRLDLIRQTANIIAAPLIWICSSRSLYLESARSQSEFSELTSNILVPFPIAFSIWFPIFVGIFAYAILQALKVNRARTLFRETGWWIAAGLWGIVAWGLATAFLNDDWVELCATLIFIPTMIALVIAMVRISQPKVKLGPRERWLVLMPISLIAGWCSIAVFIGLNGVIWKSVEPLGWSIVGTGLLLLGLALLWIIFVLRRGAVNKAYAFPIIWGLGFLALRHADKTNGSVWIFGGAIIGILAVFAAVSIKPTSPQIETQFI